MDDTRPEAGALRLRFASSHTVANLGASKMALVEGIVLRSTAGFFRVRAGESTYECKLRGRLKKEKVRTDLVVIGDSVEIETSGSRDGVIERVLTRRTKFSRLHPTSRGRAIEDVLVANLDRVLIVFSASIPPMNPRLLDRFIVVAEHNRVAPILIANKVDTTTLEDVRARFGLYERIGYSVHFTSAETGTGIEPLRELLASGISALTGPSGVGKSSLANAIEKGLSLATGEVSETLRKGMHTTRVAELHRLSSGGWLADTPGIRELASFEIPQRELGSCFIEFRPHISKCAFNDCLHDKEPDCGVREAVERGDVSNERYDSYLRMLVGEDGRA